MASEPEPETMPDDDSTEARFARVIERREPGLSLRKIAVEVGVSDSTVDRWLQRAKDGLGPPGPPPGFGRVRAQVVEPVEPPSQPSPSEPIIPSATRETLPAPVYLRAVFDALRAHQGLDGSFGDWLCECTMAYLEEHGIGLVLTMP